MLTALLLLGAGIASAPSNAAGISMTLTTSPPRLQLSAAPGATTTKGTIHAIVRTPAAASLSVRVADAVASEDGRWMEAPTGSTSYSLSPALTWTPQSVELPASADDQTIDIALTLPTDQMDKPRAGIVSVILVPAVAGPASDLTVQQGLRIETIVVSEVATQPLTGNADVRVSLLGTGLTADPANEFTIVDSTIPDVIPGLVDHGPVTTAAHYRNNGDFIVDAQTTFDFASVGPMAMFGSDDPGDVFYTLNDAHHYALPGQPAVAKGTSLVEANGAKVDSLPFIGFVKVTATTTGTLGPLAAAPVVQSTVFLVFPWKEALALLLVIVLWVLFKRWRRNRRDRKNQPPPSAEVREPVESVT